MGGVITIVYGPDGGHNPAGAVELVTWMADRFEDRAPVNDC
jgi:folylpolyglutamate synthase/dihydropteroate synthase